MSKYQKGDIVYRAWLAPFEGHEHPVAILSIVSVVCPQRDGRTTYHVRNFGMAQPGGGIWPTFNVEESALYAEPLEAMAAAVAASKQPAKTEAANA